MIYKSMKLPQNLYKNYLYWPQILNRKSLSTIQRRNYRHADTLVLGGTIPKLKEDLRLILGVEKGYKPVRTSREHLNKFLTSDKKDLPPRSIRDSFLYGFIPLSNDEVMQDKYVDDLGEIRWGRLMEDLDIFAAATVSGTEYVIRLTPAVMVLQKYIYLPNLPDDTPCPYTIVTVLVSSTHFSDYKPKADQDIRISGYVTCVGTSSASIAIWLEQLSYNSWIKITQANILMAARDASNSHSVPINPLEPGNDKDKSIIAAANEVRKNMTLQRKSSLTRSLPTIEEQNVIHKLYLKSCGNKVFCQATLPKGFRWMKYSKLSHTCRSFPEDRNLHNTVFGGHIMRMTIELASACCTLYSKHTPKLVGISDVTFHKPIAVGSIIKMNAHVVYTDVNYLQVTVDVDAIHKALGMSNTTNTVQLTYELPEYAHPVMPYSYQEAMMYIEGLRHFNKMMHEKPKDLEQFYMNDELN